MQPTQQPTTSPRVSPISRRSFLQRAGAGALAFSLPSLPSFLKDAPMGFVVHTYAHRWHSDAGSSKYPGFANALDLLNHCHQIGAGGVQVGVRDWTTDFAREVRTAREKLNLYLEGSIGLPRSGDEVETFEQEVKNAKEAGARVLRTVCLSGRRYENFHSQEEFKEFKKNAIESLQRAEPVVRKHQMKLAVENHKDWRAPELVAILRDLDSEWVGVTLDFGNSISLMEDPMEVVEALVPYVFTTHVKDMAVQPYEHGFLMSEVPLGDGILDLPRIVSLCKKHNPEVVFNLEMITRNPLEIPCLTSDYWSTLPEVPGGDLARTLRMVREHEHASELPRVSDLSAEQRLAVEEQNVTSSLAYSNDHLALYKP